MQAGELSLNLSWGGQAQWRSRLSNSAITQACIQDFELANSIYGLLEHAQGLVLWNYLCRISMTWGNKDTQGEFQWGSSIDGVAEARGLEPDQPLIEMNSCK